LHTTHHSSQGEKGNYDSFDKLSFEEDGLDNSYEYLVRNNDIDFIGHMNNTKYADALIINGCVKHFEINFIHEVKLNEILQIKHDFNNYVGYNNETLSFKAKCIYF
jgi:acyl-ACP thioesterase